MLVVTLGVEYRLVLYWNRVDIPLAAIFKIQVQASLEMYVQFHLRSLQTQDQAILLGVLQERDLASRYGHCCELLWTWVRFEDTQGTQDCTASYKGCFTYSRGSDAFTGTWRSGEGATAHAHAQQRRVAYS